MLPLIGITCGVKDEGYYLTRYYSQGVRVAGGLPVLLPPLDSDGFSHYHQVLDGLLLAGGVDVDPVHFGEEPLPGLGQISPERDSFELGLTKCFLEQSKPILAICRGMQVLNIAAGGSVWQDLQAQPGKLLKHVQDAPKWYATHGVELLPDTMLKKIFRNQNLLRVNSFHHQAVRMPAPGFRVSARSKDGVIEAIESAGNDLWLGVQWHPECMWEKDRQQLELFKWLVSACKTGKTC